MEKIEIKEVEHKQSWSNNVIPNDEDWDDESEPEQKHEVSNMQDIDSLSTFLETFNVFNTRPPPLENHQVLRKNDKICFKRKDNNE